MGAILTAEGERQSAILKAEGDAKAAILRADGESQAIQKVFGAIHKGNPTQKLLAYQYLQTLPKLADGSSNKLWIIPSEVGEALKGIGNVLGKVSPDSAEGGTEAGFEAPEPPSGSTGGSHSA